MSVTVDEFRKDGWNLTDDGICLLKEWTELETPTFDQCLSAALNGDLRQFCKSEIGREMPEKINAPLVLQLQEVVNIAAPLQHQVEHPRMLRAVFTDGGKKKIKGVEMAGKVDGLRLSTPPGTKFVVTKDIPVKEDLLMLGPGLLKNIGGHVEAMVNEWKASKQFITRSTGSKAKSSSEESKEDDSGPPPFVSYKIPIDKSSKPTQQNAAKNTSGDILKDGQRKAPNAQSKAKRTGQKEALKSDDIDSVQSAAKDVKEQDKGKKGPKPVSKPKNAEKRSSESKPKRDSADSAKPKESVKAPKSNRTPSNVENIQGTEPVLAETANVKPRNKTSKKGSGKPTDLAADLKPSEGDNGQAKGPKVAKSKRPEQQYYTPKPRNISQEASSSAEGKGLALETKNVASKNKALSDIADQSGLTMPIESDQSGGQANTRPADRGRGRGRGHHSRGRGRGQRGRGGSASANAPGN